MGIARGHARLSGVVMRVVPAQPVLRLDIEQRELVAERVDIHHLGEQTLGLRRHLVRHCRPHACVAVVGDREGRAGG